eukprot:362265-Chlamydomonas_euryale.AAC.10
MPWIVKVGHRLCARGAPLQHRRGTIQAHLQAVVVTMLLRSRCSVRGCATARRVHEHGPTHAHSRMCLQGTYLVHMHAAPRWCPLKLKSFGCR